MEKNPNKGYVALLGWSLSAIEALDNFDRRAGPWITANSTVLPMCPGTLSV